jgi:hypothetical protein
MNAGVLALACPHVFLVPATVLFKYFEGGGPGTRKHARYHPLIEEVQVD